MTRPSEQRRRATRALAVAVAVATGLLWLALASVGVGGPAGASVAQADASVIGLTVTPAANPLGTQVKLTASTSLPPASIATIDFEYAPADTSRWASLGTNPTMPGGLPPYAVAVDTTALPDGLYDLRAVLTGTDGTKHVSATTRDQLVANSSPVVTLSEPGQRLATGSAVRLTVPLSAVQSTQVNAAPDVATISFQVSPASQDQWTAIGTLAPTATGASVSFDTRTVPDGVYDVRAVPFDAAGDGFATIPLRGIVVDNTPPTIGLTDPGSPLTGSVNLTTQAADAGSGVATVQFQAAKANTRNWQQIGMAAHAPFAHAFDTTTLDNGSYDFRAIATDVSGNVAISSSVTDTVSNPPQAPGPQAAIQGVAVPAHGITMLGSVAASGDHETWATGFTTAPPATAGGQVLPYTAEGDQFVLLRYTDESGWEIADVLRNPDGSAFKLLPSSASTGDSVSVVGQMTASGEAWLWIYERSADSSAPSVFGLFHRSPGKAFLLDPSATQAVGAALLTSLTGASELRLGQTGDGQEYGVLTAPDQPSQSAAVRGATGATVTISEQLDYALLDHGTWKRESAPLAASYSPAAHDAVTLAQADVDGPDTGWGTLAVQNPLGTPAPRGSGLLLGHFSGANWSYVQTGLDALDLTGTVTNAKGSVTPTALKADDTGVWVGATVTLPTTSSRSAGGPVVARYATSGRVTNSWCSLPVASSCDQPLDPDHPAAVPDAVFTTSTGTVAVSLQRNLLDVFSRGAWSALPAPGFPIAHDATFSSPTDGWLGGQSAVGHVSAQAPSDGAGAGPASLLTTWPIAVRSPLTSVALPPASTAGIDESGALAVGLNGTALAYDAGAGWQVEATPARAHHINLMSVAFAGPSSAFAVGQFGLILHWDGSSWSEDPQSISITQERLNSVAFSATGEGWAVGANGTILHYDGSTWSIEQPPAVDASTNITSVAVAGSDVFAIANGNLIVRDASGAWTRADPSILPGNPAPPPGALRVVSGMPDGGAVIAGRSLLLVRQRPGQPFEYSDQPLEGIAVAASAFRDAGTVRAAVSIAPPAADSLAPFEPTSDVGGFPSGDGELLIENANGWQDLSRAAQAGTAADLPPDGEVKPDPVLAVATSPDGQHAWVVGGYDGTPTGSGLGTAAIQPARPAGWQTASLWRYDAGGSTASNALSTTTPSVPAAPNIVSFAFFSSPLCRVQCAGTQDAQPDVNLKGAIDQIGAFAAQPGGPAFAMLGGDARGPSDPTAWGAGNGAFDFTRLPNLLSGLSVPLFAAPGPLDAVPTERSDPYQSWASTFAGAPQPFGSGPAPAGISTVASGASDGVVSRYYAFDASQNGATIRVIVLDNSKGSLEASDIGQTDWLGRQLAAASAAGLPVVAVAALPLSQAAGNGAADGPSVAATLVSAGVLAVFTSDSTQQLNEVRQIPDNATTTIPEYEGASLGYQQPQNDGVVWYDVSVDTQARTVSVDAVPVIQSLTLQPLTGLNVARSLTLQFQAIARRPAGSLATAPEYSDTFAGFDSYAEIPSPSCGTEPCITPTYSFSSADPTIGNFVTPSGPGSAFPKLTGSGHPIPNPTSGLFCAFNPGTTEVSITAGLLTYSLTVTVKPGGFGAPCGTVPAASAGSVAKKTNPVASAAAAAGAPPPPAAAATATPAPVLKLPPAPAPAVHPAPHVAVTHPVPVPVPTPIITQVAAQVPVPVLVPIVVPPATPAQPIPPGGATAPSAAQAPRREKARKHASQSAFTTLTPGREQGAPWSFYVALGGTVLLALMLSAQGLRPRRRDQPAYARRRPTRRV